MIVDIVCSNRPEDVPIKAARDLSLMIPGSYEYQKIPSEESECRFLCKNGEWSLRWLPEHVVRLKLHKGCLEFDSALKFVEDIVQNFEERSVLEIKLVGPWNWNAAEKVF